jgi:hypothetical protein
MDIGHDASVDYNPFMTNVAVGWVAKSGNIEVNCPKSSSPV